MDACLELRCCELGGRVWIHQPRSGDYTEQRQQRECQKVIRKEEPSLQSMCTSLFARRCTGTEATGREGSEEADQRIMGRLGCGRIRAKIPRTWISLYISQCTTYIRRFGKTFHTPVRRKSIYHRNQKILHACSLSPRQHYRTARAALAPAPAAPALFPLPPPSTVPPAFSLSSLYIPL